MKQSHESISELKEFIRHQAAEDAVLDAAERRYQSQLVRDVLSQSHLKPNVFKSLVNDYSRQVASNK
ncbi:MAG: hypothetical protein ACXWLH_01220 [Candidatus Saccharimonadales bacterium]